MSAFGQKRTSESAAYVICLPVSRQQTTPYGEMEPDN